MKKNVASQSVGAQMITAADGTAFTGAVSVAVTIDNGTQTAGGGTAPAHEGNGYHSYTPTQAETNGDHVAFTFTGTGAIPATVQVYTTFPQTGDNFARLGAPAGASVSADVAAVKTDTAAVKTKTDFLPSATAGASGGLLISGSNSGTTTLGALTVTGTFTVSDGLVVSRSSANQDGVSITGNGTGVGMLLQGGASNSGLKILAGTTTGDGLNIQGSSGSASAGVNITGGGTNGSGLLVSGNGTGHGISATGGSTSGDGIRATLGGTGVDIRGKITGNITGNLSGTVGSVTGAVGSVTGAVGSVTGTVGGVAGTITTLDALDTAQNTQHATTQSKVDTAQADLDILTGSDGATLATSQPNVGNIPGTAQTGTLSTTVMTTDLTGYADDELIGRVVVWTGGTAAGQASDITDYASVGGTVTFTAVTTAPLNGDTFVIV